MATLRVVTGNCVVMTFSVVRVFITVVVLAELADVRVGRAVDCDVLPAPR
jgi:hypothetical protein